MHNYGACSASKLPLSPPSTDLKLLTYRQRVFHELVKTECNYVAILDTIDKVRNLLGIIDMVRNVDCNYVAILDPIELISCPQGQCMDCRCRVRSTSDYSDPRG